MSLWHLSIGGGDDLCLRMIGLQFGQVLLRHHAHAEVDLDELSFERREECQPLCVSDITLVEADPREVWDLRDGAQCALGDCRLRHLADGEAGQSWMASKERDTSLGGL